LKEVSALEVIKFFYETMLGWIEEPVRTYVCIVLLGLLGLFTLLKSLKFVPQDHIGMRTRFNKVILRYPKTLSPMERERQKREDKILIDQRRPAQYGRPKWIKPGWQILMPWMHNIVTVEILEKTIPLNKQVRLSNDTLYDGVVLETVTIAARVVDPYLWKYATDDAQKRLTTVGDTHLSPIIASHSKQEVVDNAASIEEQFLTIVNPLIQEFGGLIAHLYLGNKLPMAAEGWIAQSIALLSQNIGMLFGVAKPSSNVTELIDQLQHQHTRERKLVS
jgi:regulator of protease activity HflC (stomatin/prohibitin superfamily)